MSQLYTDIHIVYHVEYICIKWSQFQHLKLRYSHQRRQCILLELTSFPLVSYVLVEYTQSYDGMENNGQDAVGN